MAQAHITRLVAIWSLLATTCLVLGLPTTDKNVATEDRCIDFELNKINAITNLANGSLFLVSGSQYWVLAPKEVPSLKSARQVSRLFFTSESENSADESSKPPVPSIEAAVSLRIKAHQGACVPADQTILYSWSPNNRSLVSVYENSVLYTTSNMSHVDVFGAAKSVNWTRKIDGVTFWQNMTIIFQGNSFISLKCSNGEWKEVVHKQVADVFPGVSHQSLDSVLIRNSAAEQMDLATVFMFFGQEFYKCSVTGSDPCEGPYNLLSEFFNVDHFCLDSQIGRAESNRRFLITGLIFATIVLFSVLVVFLVLYFTLKPEHFTYFVNRKMRSNCERDNLSYEALKQQNDANTAGAVECKSVTNGKS